METTGQKNCLGPPQTIRDEGEVLKEFIERLKLEVKLPEIYTLAGFIVKVREILNAAEFQYRLREMQKAIPYDSADD